MNTIYGIYCNKSRKFYVGSSTQFKQRKLSHLRSLKNNKHHSIKLQRAWNKYGEDCFNFIILEEFKDEDVILKKEQNWIDKLDSYNNGYNSRKDATPCPSGNKNGMFGKQPPNTGRPCANRKPVVSYDLNTGKVEYFDYVGQVTKKTGLGCQFLSCITFSKNNKTFTFHNKFWFYEKDFSLKELRKRFIHYNKPHKLIGKKRPKSDCEAISKGKKGIKFSKSHRKKISKSKKGQGFKKIVRSDGRVFNSLKEACEEMDMKNTSNLSHHLSGRSKSCKGFTFKYYN